MPMSKRLLVIHHTPSPHCQEMFEAVVAGATDPEIEGVEVVRRPALTVSPVEMLEADDQLLDTAQGRPFGVWLHGNEGTEGAERGLAAITTGLGWLQAAETVLVSGK